MPRLLLCGVIVSPLHLEQQLLPLQGLVRGALLRVRGRGRARARARAKARARARVRARARGRVRVKDSAGRGRAFAATAAFPSASASAWASPLLPLSTTTPLLLLGVGGTPIFDSSERGSVSFGFFHEANAATEPRWLEELGRLRVSPSVGRPGWGWGSG